MVDDSNEHMLSVWDCSRGTKLAEIKVRCSGGLAGRRAGLGAESSKLPKHEISLLAKSPGASLLASLRL